MAKLIVVRGLPGSGKSTYIQENYPGATPAAFAPDDWSPVVVSADHTFMNFATGHYTFAPHQLEAAHKRALALATKAMTNNVSEVLVDNVHALRQDWADILAVADERGYEVVVVDLFDGGLSDEELATRNMHSVPQATIAKMRAQWEA